MTQNKAYAKEALPNIYQHRFHAGNIGDVWKHSVTWALLRSLLQTPAPITLVDAYAGEGMYALGPTGEWTEGIGALLRHSHSLPEASTLHSFVAQARPLFESAKSYAGSPALLASALREGDELICYETEPNTYASLTRALEGKRAIIRGEDGMTGLLEVAQHTAGSSTRLFALVDPPWNKKEDWKTIPKATLEVLRAAPAAALALWYPIKSYTRVIGMMDYFREHGLSGTALDLITTPLSLQRNRLNGSGMLLFNCPLSVIATCSEMASYIGAACATHKGFWEFKASVVC